MLSRDALSTSLSWPRPAAAALWIGSVQAQSIPALPELAIDHFPVAARAAIAPREQ